MALSQRKPASPDLTLVHLVIRPQTAAKLPSSSLVGATAAFLLDSDLHCPWSFIHFPVITRFFF